MHRHPIVALSIALALALFSAAAAEVKLPAVLGSHMVLQQGVPLSIWGTASPGEEVTVRLGESEPVKAKVASDGGWRVALPEQKANARPQTLTVSGENKIVLEDILIGEVWVGSGQSNMEWSMSATHDAKQAIAAADHPTIRLFHVPKVQKDQPAGDVEAAWQVCSPESVPAFSGVLYHFGRKLSEELGVPVGLINSSWGGSPIEPWTITKDGSGGMYNGMIAPLVSFPIRGAVWYQGETNAMQKNGFAYADKMKALIEGWRGKWGSELSFYFVQIAPWEGRYEPGELPALWEAQAATLKLPKTGMVVTTDLVDNLKDIHPQNKRDVGERLARWALARDYGRSDLVVSGPLYKSMKVEGAGIRLNFAHAKGLATSDGEPPSEFEIAGENGEFVSAKAEIDGESVVLSADQVKSPVQARFGWHATTNPNLVNGAGLPASPFRTKEWRGGTAE